MCPSGILQAMWKKTLTTTSLEQGSTAEEIVGAVFFCKLEKNFIPKENLVCFTTDCGSTMLPMMLPTGQHPQVFSSEHCQGLSDSPVKRTRPTRGTTGTAVSSSQATRCWLTWTAGSFSGGKRRGSRSNFKRRTWGRSRRRSTERRTGEDWPQGWSDQIPEWSGQIEKEKNRWNCERDKKEENVNVVKYRLK